MNKAPKPAPAKKSPVVPVMMIAMVVVAAAIGFKVFQSSSPTPPPAGVSTHSVPTPRTAPRPGPLAEDASTPAQAAPVPRPAPRPAPRPLPEVARVDAKDL